MKPISKLGIGPMSNEIVEAVFRYSSENIKPLMLISTKNQIDWKGGYVNNWKTKDYAVYIRKMRRKYPKAKVYLCRDHCGPGFSNSNSIKDVYTTIDDDLENGFDLIHVDFCKVGERDKILKSSKKAIRYILDKSPKTLVEVGTDENTGEKFQDIRWIDESMGYFTDFCEPAFFVCQTGSLIKEVDQVGKFKRTHVVKLKKLADKYKLSIKEHNADYLTKDEIRTRRSLVSAVNVAPQYGVLQTKLTLQKCTTYGIDQTDYLNKSYNSKRWKKWLYKNDANNKYLCSIIAGHYNFSTKAYKDIYDQISKYEDFRDTIIVEMMKNFRIYYDNL